MNFQQILKSRRKELNYTLKDIANKIGVTEATVQRWESGNIKNLRQNRLSKLAEILEIQPATLMGWENKTNMSNSPLSKESGLSDKQREIINLFDSAPPELQAAALAVLKSAEVSHKLLDDAEAKK